MKGPASVGALQRSLRQTDPIVLLAIPSSLALLHLSILAPYLSISNLLPKRFLSATINHLRDVPPLSEPPVRSPPLSKSPLYFEGFVTMSSAIQSPAFSSSALPMLVAASPKGRATRGQRLFILRVLILVFAGYALLSLGLSGPAKSLSLVLTAALPAAAWAVLRFNLQPRLWIRVLLAALISVTALNMVAVWESGYGFLWLYLIPPMVFFFFGHGEGVLWTLGTLTLMTLALGLGAASIPHSTELVIGYLCSFFHRFRFRLRGRMATSPLCPALDPRKKTARPGRLRRRDPPRFFAHLRFLQKHPRRQRLLEHPRRLPRRALLGGNRRSPMPGLSPSGPIDPNR